MKARKKNLLILLSFLSIASAHAQILSPDRIRNRVKQRAEDRAAQEVDNRVDKGVDKVLDGLFGTVDKGAKAATDAVKDAATDKPEAKPKTEDASQEDAMAIFGKMMGGMGQGPAPDASYDFSSSYTVKLTTIDGKKDPQTFNLKYHFTKDGDYFGSTMEGLSMEGGEAMKGQFMLYDMEKSTMYTFMDMNGQKNMLSIAMKDVENMAEDKIDENIAKTTYTKTGQTKTIAGYSCEGYKMTQDGKDYLVWISKSAVPVVSTYYKNLSKASIKGQKGIQFNYASNPELMEMMKAGRALLGMEMEDDGVKTEMEVLEIKPNDNFSFQTAGYGNMMDFNKIMRDAQNQSKE